jgi:hypothetical protein
MLCPESHSAGFLLDKRQRSDLTAYLLEILIGWSALWLIS